MAGIRAYMLGNDPQWEAVKEKAFHHNGWFIPEFIELAVSHIAHLLEPANLRQWLNEYDIPDTQASPRSIGVVMPGNLPLAGFYDLACIYLSGHRQRIKLSPKDNVLLKHLVTHPLKALDPTTASSISFEDMLKGCDAYLATDTGTLAPYLGKYAGILRKPQRRVALLTGDESTAELELLADDVFLYFGQGCMNVNKLLVPRDFDFIPLLKAFDKYRHLADHNKYMNNYDYQLALLILNKEFYMTNGSILLSESAAATSPIARLHYEYYDDEPPAVSGNHYRVAGKSLESRGYEALGEAGQSVICEHKIGIDTLKFLLDL